MEQTQEQLRLQAARDQQIPWKKWGPYLSERQWGTVREDYSPGGDAWDYFTHDQARSRAYRWGEDGIAGISDSQQRLCFGIALWNGADPILKERMFGLTNSEGNHGEDVKEYYFYLDSTPTHSYMKYLYKYPQKAFPYNDLIQVNRQRSKNEFEYELIDTGIFNEDRYFDIVVEYAKQSPEDLLIQITAHNRGPEKATLHLLPTVWFRNTWWMAEKDQRPNCERLDGNKQMSTITTSHPTLGKYTLYCEGEAPLLFTENETNQERIFGTFRTRHRMSKTGSMNTSSMGGRRRSTHPAYRHQSFGRTMHSEIGPGKAQVVRLRLTDTLPTGFRRFIHMAIPFGEAFTKIMDERRNEADAVLCLHHPPKVRKEGAMVMRQALAGCCGPNSITSTM